MKFERIVGLFVVAITVLCIYAVAQSRQTGTNTVLSGNATFATVPMAYPDANGNIHSCFGYVVPAEQGQTLDECLIWLKKKLDAIPVTGVDAAGLPTSITAERPPIRGTLY